MRPFDADMRLRSEEWTVETVSLATARNLVRRYHYAKGGANTATHVHGLFRRGEMGHCYGVAWWIPPTRTAAGAWWPVPEEVLSLSRLAIAPEAPKNAATFLLARSVKMLGRRWKCLITYADTWRGHTGGIYRAAGWEYLGTTAPEATFTKNGVLIARKAGPRCRTRAEMAEMGCIYEGDFAKHRFRLVRTRLPATSKELFSDDEAVRGGVL